MSDISKVDKNFKTETSLNLDDVIFYDVREEPFKVYGLYNYKNEEKFRRIPEALAKKTSEGVYFLHANTAGGRVRFKTNSPYVAIKVKMHKVIHISNMPLASSSGFDMYINNGGKSTYFRTFIPPENMTDGYESMHVFESEGEKSITINFPLYNDVTELYVGLSKDASLKEDDDYTYTKPIVYYGSSITQGAAASHPGNAYPAIISRMFDTDYINLGFAGNCKGEMCMEEYIADIDMSIFVYDYDYNAPDAEYLKKTHEKFFKKFREKQPDTPVVFITKPNFYELGMDKNILRREVIINTYENAVNSGDKNVYFVDGKTLLDGNMRDACTVDSCHPGDIGFLRMAEKIGAVIGKILL